MYIRKVIAVERSNGWHAYVYCLPEVCGYGDDKSSALKDLRKICPQARFADADVETRKQQ